MRFPFRLKIALVAAACAAVPLVTLGWLLIDVNAREVESSSQALQIALVEQVAGRIDAQAERTERALSAIARALADGELDPDLRLALALRLLEGEPELDVVAVYDASGALIDRMRDRESRAKTPEVLPAALRERAAREGSAAGEPARDEDDDVRVLVVVPLRADDRVTGYAAAPVSLASLQTEVERLSRAHLAGDEGALFVIDGAGRALAHPDPSRRLEPAGVEIDVRTLSRAPISGEQVDARGRTWLATRAALERRPWAVVARIPEDVAYASLAQMRAIVLSTTALALLVAVAASFLLARRLAAPIARLVAFTKELAARRFDARVSIATADELAVLGDALNDAAAELSASEQRAREEMAIRADLGRYLPAELVEAIIRREASMELGGRRTEVTVLFADVVAFTPSFHVTIQPWIHAPCPIPRSSTARSARSPRSAPAPTRSSASGSSPPSASRCTALSATPASPSTSNGCSASLGGRRTSGCGWLGPWRPCRTWRRRCAPERSPSP
ncbi:MAG TPA: HAMP domain-containing protein [Sandaracinaceae bacterium]